MASRHNWTPEQVSYLLEQLRAQAEAGKRAGQSFKDETWKIVTDRVNLKFKLKLTIKQLKAKNQTERTRLQVTLAMKSRSGWGWDDTINAPTNDADVIKGYISTLKKEHQSVARDITTHGCKDFMVLSELYQKNMASGKLAKSSNASVSEAAEAEDGDDFDADSDDDKAPNSESSYQQQLVPPANSVSPITQHLNSPLSNSSQVDSISSASDHSNSSRSSSVSSKSSISSNSTSAPKMGAKRSASPGLGERAKRAHKPLSQVAALTNTLDRAVELMMAPQPVAPAPVAPVVPPLVLPESVQLTMVVAKKLNGLLTRLNGRFNGEDCPWLLPRMTYKFGKVLAKPHNAAMFLGTESDEALVELLQDLQDEF
ncbi:UNVERIFIED_CONTAM: hypothetical protein HDU68_005662 [Siphonaria sp. JEL0065]|nr:hypothetical protein HDU68_005662 [Siphonaria sp. JEL0065]